MSNGIAHRLVAAVTVGISCVYAEVDCETKSVRPLGGVLLAAGFTNFPDIIEPAHHPNHRQFFHSIAFATLVGLGACNVYKWETDNDVDSVIRFVLLVGAGSYLIHLLLDATTPKSLPLIGKL